MGDDVVISSGIGPEQVGPDQRKRFLRRVHSEGLEQPLRQFADKPIKR
ncbi:hypothetical protein [Phenylobacterium sp.]|nr:hypothetical protein [Phenylobacterium sp.]